MHTTTRSPVLRSSVCAVLLFAAPLAAVACGDNPPANPPPQPTSDATAAPTAEATAVPTAAATAVPTAAPTAEATVAATGTAAPTQPPRSGRPPVLLSDPKSITDTFGFSPGAKLELGDKEIATLRIPEGALGQATNVTFAIDTKCKTSGLVFGKVYKITPVFPPSTTPVSVPSSSGAPYSLTMPTAKKKDLNLAIGTYTKDAKGNESLKWQIIAPKKTDEAGGTEEFHLDTLPDGCLHLTNKAPT